jgi:ribosomal protein L11 methyltransferase
MSSKGKDSPQCISLKDQFQRPSEPGETKQKKGYNQNKPVKHWLAVSLLIPKDYGEAVSNFLIEQGATGVEEIDEGSERMRVKTYLLQDGNEKKAFSALQRYLKSLEVMSPEMRGFQVETHIIPDQDWGESWKRFFRPIQVTSRFVVKPPWSSLRLKRGQILIDITPGMAFGTGTHATTRLCIRALEKWLKRRGLSVLDVGTGSGILSIVSSRLGAAEVLGLDKDGTAVEMARENVKQNNVSNGVKIKKGNLGNVRKKFDMVVANIDLRSLRRMRWPLVRHLKGKGILIVSGILERDKEKLLQFYLETGLLKKVKTAQEEEWVCLTFRRK